MLADLESLIISALNGGPVCFWRKEWPLWKETPFTQRTAPFQSSSLRDGNPKRMPRERVSDYVTGDSTLRIRSNIHPTGSAASTPGLDSPPRREPLPAGAHRSGVRTQPSECEEHMRQLRLWSSISLLRQRTSVVIRRIAIDCVNVVGGLVVLRCVFNDEVRTPECDSTQ